MANEAPQKQLEKTEGATQAPEPRPAHYSVEFLIETEEGYHVLFRGEELAPADMFAWLKRTSKTLAAQGFKAVRRDMAVDVDVGSPSGATAASGEATWVKGEGPPECSIHGPAKWVAGTYKAGTPRAGQKYAFWACSANTTNNPCKPKGEPA
jgi:hypothetical protein